MALALELVFLGSGNAFAPGRYWSGFLANGRYLFDAPPTALPHLKKLGLSPDAIEAVFITHFHADHLFGLPFLLLEYAIITHRQVPLWVVGPPGIKWRLRTVCDAGFPNLFEKELEFPIHFIDAQDGGHGTAADLPFRSSAIDHVGPLQSRAYRTEIGGRTLVYTGDSRDREQVASLADGADVLVLECSCWEGSCGPHISGDDVIELRRRLPATTTIVATHLEDGRRDLGEGILLADDFAKFRF